MAGESVATFRDVLNAFADGDARNAYGIEKGA